MLSFDVKILFWRIKKKNFFKLVMVFIGVLMIGSSLLPVLSLF